MKHVFSRIPQLPRRKRYLLYIAIAVLGVVFFERIVLQAAMGRIKKLNNEIFIQEKKMQKALYILSQEESIIKEHAKCIEGVGQKHSGEEEKAKLLYEIERLARSASISLKNIKPGLTKKIGPYEKYTAEIEVESTMNYLTDFIYRLERSPRLLRVEDFQLRPKEKRSSIIKGRLTITEVLIGKKNAP